MTLKLNKEHIQLAIAAMRSGMYEQFQCKMKQGNSFCALGVMCDVYHKQTGNGWWAGNIFMTHEIGGVKGNGTVLPTEASIWYGISDSLAVSVVHWNDCLLMTLPEIANSLERAIAREEQQ